VSHQPLRLESIGDFLQKIIDLYRRNVRLFAEILLVPSVVVTISGLWIERLVERMVAIAELTDPAERLAQVTLPTVGILVYFVTITIIQCASLGAIAAAVQEVQRGRSIDVPGAWLRAAKHLAGIVTIGAAYPIASIAGAFVAMLVFIVPMALLGALVGQPLFILFAAPFVIGCMIAIPLLLVRYALAVPVLVNEDAGTLQAFRRSASLTKGSRLFLVIVLLIALLSANVVAFIFQGPFMAARWLAGEGSFATVMLIGQAIAGTIGSALGMPFPMLAICLLYVELKNREQTITIGV